MALWNKIPWTFTLIIYLIVTHSLHVPMDGIVGYVFIGLGMAVIFVEFFKSGDTNSIVFLIDLLFAIIGIIVATVLLSFLIFVNQEIPNFFYWFGYAIILGDAIISPFNAYRTALRNFGTQGQ